MTPFIGLTRAGATREVRVNPAAIAFVDVAGGAGACVTFSGGAQLLVAETPEVIERRIHAAEGLELAVDPAARRGKGTR